MKSTLLTLTALLLLAADPAPPKSAPRKPHPLAPSLPELTDEEEAALDKIIDRFIEFDTGKLQGAEGKKALAEFNKLSSEAIPALIRGMNRAATIDHSCPATVIAKKLSRLFATTQDRDLLEFARENLGAGVKQSRHMGVLKDLQVQCLLRNSALARAGVPTASEQTRLTTAASLRELRTMTIPQLAENAGKQRGDQLKKTITELGQRTGDEVIAALVVASDAAYETEIRQFASEVLEKVLSKLSVKEFKEMLKHERSTVRLAALRVVTAKGHRWGRELIALLNDADPAVELAAHQTLVKLNNGVDYGPAPNAKERDRAEAVRRWEEWWTKQEGR